MPLHNVHKASFFTFGPCVRCDETIVKIVMYRYSKDKFDGMMTTPTCLNEECKEESDHDPDGIRMFLPLTSHKIFNISIKVLEEVEVVDLSNDDHFAPDDHEHTYHLKTGICVFSTKDGKCEAVQEEEE